jgi:hypothetical protein
MEKGSCSATPGTTGDCGPEKSRCCGKIIKGAILGGLVMFAWFSLSWMVLPWHHHGIMPFKDEAAVAATLEANAPESGIYVVPHTDMNKAEQATARPFAFVSVFAPGVDMKAAMPATMLKGLALYVVLAGLLSCLLAKSGGPCCPVGLSFKTGLLAGLAAFLPLWIWWHFPCTFVAIGILDYLVAFTLAGFVVSKLIFKYKVGCSASACKTGPCDK